MYFCLLGYFNGLVGFFPNKGPSIYNVRVGRGPNKADAYERGVSTKPINLVQIS